MGRYYSCISVDGGIMESRMGLSSTVSSKVFDGVSRSFGTKSSGEDTRAWSCMFWCLVERGLPHLMYAWVQ